MNMSLPTCIFTHKTVGASAPPPTYRHGHKHSERLYILKMKHDCVSYSREIFLKLL